MRSKDRIRPHWPKQFDQFTEIFKSAEGADFTPGTLVVPVNNLLVKCDRSIALHQSLPALMVWEDGSVRHDVGPLYNRDGTAYDNYTCFVADIIADASADLFTAVPEAGDKIVKSTTPGKMDPLSAAEYATLVGSDVENTQLVVGTVIGTSKYGASGYYSCKFNFGAL